MNKSIGIFAVVVLSMAISGAAGTAAKAAGVSGPLGYKLMCLKYPEECRGGGKSKVAADAAIMAKLKRINAAVNSSIRPRHDSGGTDVWTIGASAGDCEDYVMTKRRQLIKAGLPASSLRVAHVKTRSGQDHAVLVVRTSKGDLVLDNLTGTIKPMSQTGHRVISMQGANPKHWS